MVIVMALSDVGTGQLATKADIEASCVEIKALHSHVMAEIKLLKWDGQAVLGVGRRRKTRPDVVADLNQGTSYT